MQASVDSFRSSVDIAGSQRRWELAYLLHSFFLFTFVSFMVYAAVAFFDSKRGFMVAYDDVSFHGGRELGCFSNISMMFSLAVWWFYVYLQEEGEEQTWR
jgi:hypothetical protein